LYPTRNLSPMLSLSRQGVTPTSPYDQLCLFVLGLPTSLPYSCLEAQDIGSPSPEAF
jgi:hypothetical protein